MLTRSTITILLVFCASFINAQEKFAQGKTFQADVVIVGGGTGGTAAGIQSARSGAKTIIIESTPWLGGMISAAGVSAIDGNHRLPSGLWAEFRNRIYKVYGGARAVETGWVSNTLFEPHVADSIFKKMASDEKNLTVIHHYRLSGISKSNKKITGLYFRHVSTSERIYVKGSVFIDATELGDVMNASGTAFDLGMEAGSITGEKVGIEKSVNIVQDLTWVAILKDYGAGADRTIPKPANYDPAEFDGSSTDYYHDKKRPAPSVDAKKMLDYGKLPNNKYMLNWPIFGNDTYLNVVNMTHEEREKELVKAKETTLRFVYFIQHQLGFKNLGLADDEFPTADKLALIPYHREGRRLKGIVRFTMRHIAEPFTYGDPLYRTGISVGDYPIDHHHKKNPEAPQHLEFYPIPSFNVPLGSLIPQQTENLVVAEKGISVSNVANGTTRLQPCVLLTGQAAGALAALSVNRKTIARKVPVRAVQEELLKSKAYLMPYIDVTPEQTHFESVQRVGATGIIKGTGIPYKWANQTWFYPDSLVVTASLTKDLNEFKKYNYQFAGTHLTIDEAIGLLSILDPSWTKKINKGKNTAGAFRSQWEQWGLKNFEEGRKISRIEFAVLLDKTIKPFSMRPVDHRGAFGR